MTPEREDRFGGRLDEDNEFVDALLGLERLARQFDGSLSRLRTADPTEPRAGGASGASAVDALLGLASLSATFRHVLRASLPVEPAPVSVRAVAAAPWSRDVLR
jgi:hypothetical protein